MVIAFLTPAPLVSGGFTATAPASVARMATPPPCFQRGSCAITCASALRGSPRNLSYDAISDVLCRQNPVELPIA